MNKIKNKQNHIVLEILNIVPKQLDLDGPLKIWDTLQQQRDTQSKVIIISDILSMINIKGSILDI